jgi:1-aminocyclopropane-1-carboxylate deaminase/D-cysteine desulfhydrase-like pyridoxal-dependent ACC family enzyme
MTMKLALFEKYPALEGRIPWVPLGIFPTPVQKLEKLGKKVGYENLWIKRDDKSSDVYGGNKVRKLEFLLADARKKGCKWVITYGGIGTNHGLATTMHAARLGLKTALVLISQPLTDHVQENLLLDGHFGAEIHYGSNDIIAGLQTAGIYLRHGNVYFISPGGSTTLGSVGYINAALELKQQVDAGLLPEPAYIFCALGSKGTLAGLIVGCRLAGMKTKVIGVKVAHNWVTSAENTVRLCNRMIALLRSYDRSIPALKFTMKDIEIIYDFFGGEYGRVTAEGEQALALIEDTEGVRLELTYTAKTLAAMLDYIKKHPEMNGGPVVFWNTYNGVDLSEIIKKSGDHTKLPASVQWCFEKNLVSCLDR